MKFVVECGIPNHMLSSATLGIWIRSLFISVFFFFFVEANDIDAGLFKIPHFLNRFVFIVE